jgi:hypothetical protein
MTIGDTSIFAIESEITRAFERPSWRGLGFFVIHVAGQRYGIKSPGQSVSQCWPALSMKLGHESPDATHIARRLQRRIALPYVHINGSVGRTRIATPSVEAIHRDIGYSIVIPWLREFYSHRTCDSGKV